MIYIVCFVVSSYLFHRSVSRPRNTGKIMFALSIIILTLLAAFRSHEVGIDVDVYVLPLVRTASSTSFADYMVYTTVNGRFEAGYAVLTYLCANYLGGLPAILGIAQFITIFFVFMRIRDFKDQAPIFVMSMFYLLLLYNRSLNLVRQCMAMAIVFYATRYIDKKKIRFVVLVLIASTFHSSAVLGFVFLLLTILIGRNFGTLRTFMVSLIATLLIAFYDTLLANIVSYVFGSSSQINLYFTSDGSGYISILALAFKLLPILLILIFGLLRGNRERLCDIQIGGQGSIEVKNGENIYLYYFEILFLNLLLYCLTFFNGNSYRLALYFQMMIPVILPQLRKTFANNSLAIADSGFVIGAFLYWCIFMSLDSYETIPYILGILN